MRKTIKGNLLKGVTSLALALVLSFQAHADDTSAVNNLIVFGDSLSDPGNAFILTGQQSLPPYDLIPDAAYAVGGHHFSNGKTWAEVFASEMHAKAKPAFRFTGDSNFAIGGSRARAVGPANLSMQVATYLNQSAPAADQSLVVIFIGSNDVRDAIVALATDPSGQTSGLILQEAITSISDNMLALIQAGAKRFLVFNAPDLSLTPAVGLQGPQVQFVANLLSSQFNQGLDQVVAGLSQVFPIEIVEYDLFSTLHALVANQEDLQLDVVNQPCITPGVLDGAICDAPNSFLFWDGIHPTRVVHRFIGQDVADMYSSGN